MTFAFPTVLVLLALPVLLLVWECQRRGTTLAMPFDHAGAKRGRWLEGIVKMSKYGTGKKAKAAAGPKRGRGRPKGSKTRRPAASRSGGVGSVDDLVSTIQNLQDERDRALDAIDQIRKVLDSL